MGMDVVRVQDDQLLNSLGAIADPCVAATS
jgi:hypothetical protein